MKQAFRRQRSLKRRLQSAALIPSVVIFCALLVLFTQVRLFDLRNDLMQIGEIVASNLAPTLEYPLISGNLSMARQIISKSLERSPASQITVYDQRGEIFVSAQKNSDLSQPGELSRFVSPILQEPLAMNDVSMPGSDIPEKAQTIGQVEVMVSDLAIYERRNEIILSSVVVGICVLIFTLIFINRVVSSVVAPLTYISNRIRAMTRGTTTESRRQKSRISEIVELEKDLADLATQLDASAQANNRRGHLADVDRRCREQLSRCKSEIQLAAAAELLPPIRELKELLAESTAGGQYPTRLNDTISGVADALESFSLIAKLDLLDRPGQSETFDLKSAVHLAISHARQASPESTVSLNQAGFWPEEALAQGDKCNIVRLLSGLFELAAKEAAPGEVVIDGRIIEDGAEFFTLTAEVEYRHRSSDKPVNTVADSRRQMPFEPSIQSALIPRLIEILGGNLRCQTVNQLKRLTVQVPLARAKADTHKHSQMPSLQTGSIKQDRLLSLPRVLIISALEPVCSQTAEVLRTFGLDAEFAITEEQALEKVRGSTEPYTAIIVDVMSPGLDGFHVSLAVRQWEEGRGQASVPMIGLTALPDSTETACLEAGMNGCVARPPKRDALRLQLSRTLHI